MRASRLVRTRARRLAFSPTSARRTSPCAASAGTCGFEPRARTSWKGRTGLAANKMERMRQWRFEVYTRAIDTAEDAAERIRA
eukprot:6214609-Pleurochrysis_carterae.AAC.3